MRALKDTFDVSKLIFFSFIAGDLMAYLTIFQFQKPLTPFCNKFVQRTVVTLNQILQNTNMIFRRSF